MQRYNAILLFGPPGSGKGTQGKALGSLPGFFHCSCGDVFRSMDMSTDLGRAFLEYSSKGQLVPDEITIQLWLDRIMTCVETGGFTPETDHLVLDGIPRNPKQASLMDTMVAVQHVFHLTGVPREEIALRLKKRALKDNRLDDASDDVVHRRMKVYESEAAALLDHYPPERITHVSAAQPSHRVLKDILQAVIGAEQSASVI